MNQHIFIGGLHRSGTWLQTHCLEEHPLISRLAQKGSMLDNKKSYLTEGQFLQSVYPPDSYYGGVGQLGFHPDINLNEYSDLCTEDNRRKLSKEWNQYWDLNKPFLLEKTPANLMRSRFLQAMFDNACFVFVLRHPVAVALAQQKWTGTSIMSLIEHWLVCHEMLMEDIGYLERFMFSRYEDFVTSPVDGVNMIYSFLGLDMEPVNQVVRADGNDKYFSIWNDALNDSGNERTILRRLLGKLMPFSTAKGYPITILRKEIPAIIQRYETRVNRFGYSLRNLAMLEELKISEKSVGIKIK